MSRLFCAMLIILFCSECNNPAGRSTADSAQEIKMNYNNYKRAVLNNNPTQSTLFISSHIFTYYDGIIQKAVNYDSLQLEGIPLMDKTIVLMARHYAGYRLLDMDGKDLYILFNEKLSGHGESVRYFDGTEVSIHDSIAELHLTYKGESFDGTFQFVNENGKWLLNEMERFESSIPDIMQTFEDDPMPDNEVILAMLEKASGKIPPASIWQPLK